MTRPWGQDSNPRPPGPEPGAQPLSFPTKNRKIACSGDGPYEGDDLGRPPVAGSSGGNDLFLDSTKRVWATGNSSDLDAGILWRVVAFRVLR